MALVPNHFSTYVYLCYINDALMRSVYTFYKITEPVAMFQYRETGTNISWMNNKNQHI